MAPQDARRGGALQADRIDEIRLADRQGFGPRQPRIGRPGGDGDGDDRILDSRPQRRDEGQRQNQPGEGQEDVGDAHQRHIHPATKIARRGAHQQADGRGDDRHQHHHHQRQARAIDDAAEDIARQIIRAHQMGPGGRQQPFGAQIAAQQRIIGRDKGREDRDQDQRQDDGKPHHRQTVAAQRHPGAIGLPQPGLTARCRLFGQKPVAVAHR